MPLTSMRRNPLLQFEVLRTLGPCLFDTLSRECSLLFLILFAQENCQLFASLVVFLVLPASSLILLPEWFARAANKSWCAVEPRQAPVRDKQTHSRNQEQGEIAREREKTGPGLDQRLKQAYLQKEKGNKLKRKTPPQPPPHPSHGLPCVEVFVSFVRPTHVRGHIKSEDTEKN